ncbi:nucleotidyl transferase AbiEii/AbiGii toxin family protein [Bifidobacterium myosotis]|nr:nucleotidyl transferase AbiEii/AbiGii toxin family protein [Bifidobacterium myosotis]
MPADRQAVAQQNVRNAILSAFLGGIGVIKGGGAISMAVPASRGRHSRDLDSSMRLDAEDFEEALRDRLEKGWQGFTGTLTPNPRRNRTRGTLMGMRPYKVALRYLGKPFCTIEFEAGPDHAGFNANARPFTPDPETTGLLSGLGFTLPPIESVDPRDQLADKLQAVSAPGAARGRDLADIATLVGRMGVIDLDDLRRRVRHVEGIEGSPACELEPGDYARLRESFDRGRPPPGYDECWRAADSLLRQVDERHRSDWMGVFHASALTIPDDIDADGGAGGRAAGTQPRKPRGLPRGEAGTFDFKRR